MLFTFVFLVVGALLFTGISPSDRSETTHIVGGASFLSLGLLNLWFALRNWLKWKHEYKEYRKE
jgi:cytochrome c biogenesis protein CcdA